MINAWINTDEKGRIISSTTFEEFAGDMQSFEFPDDFNFDKQGDYIIKDGELVRDGVQTEEEEQQKAEAAAAQAYAEQMHGATLFFVRTNAKDMNDEEAQNMSMLFPDWQVGGNYEQGDILRYNGELYRVSQKVTGAQADHTPDKAVSLYKKIGEPTGGLFPWSQPQGAHDAYKKGDKVTHNGKTWVSTIDANVWEPGVYGWEEAKE